MNSKTDYVNQSYESLKRAIGQLTYGKILVNCCQDSIRYFNQNLLTPAEFLNTVEIHPISFNMNLREENYFQQSSVLTFKFIDIEEYDNYSKKYFRVNLMNCISENSPSEELLEQLEKVT